jgi:outer membrane immunogenic protein
MRAKLLGAVLAALIIPPVMMLSLVRAGELPKTGHILTASPAAADDVQWNRTGFYTGLLAGYDVSVLQAEGLDLANGKLMGGAFVGWNFRVAPSFVLGIEADWMVTQISAGSSVDEVSIRASTDHLVSVRGRAGIPVGPVLLYGTIGPAWQHARLAISDGVDGVSDRTWQLGLAVGGGAEVELSRSFAVRLEALHYAFPENGAPLSSILDSENSHTTARVGAIFKLN